MFQILEAKGRLILEAVDSLAGERFKDFMGVQQKGRFFKEPYDIDEGFRIQEEILQELYQVIEEISDLAAKRDPDSFKKVLKKNGIYAAVVEEEGETVSIGPIDPGLFETIRETVKRPEELLFSIHTQDEGYYIIGKRNSENSKVVIFILDPNGIQRWALKVAVKEAIQLGWSKDVVWISLNDPYGDIVLSAGDSETRGRNILEISYPLTVKDGYTLKAGIEISVFVKINKDNKKHIIYSTILMAFFSIVLAVVFYKLQLSHSKKMEVMQERLMREQRLSSLGKLAAGIAHEVKNPLNAIAMAVQRLHFEFEPKDSQEAKEFNEILSVVKEQIKRLSNLVDDFTGPMRREIKIEAQNIVAIINKTLALLKEELGSRNITIKTEFQKDEILARVDAWRLEQALLNIIKNAWEAIGENGEIYIGVHYQKGNKIAIKIKDTGKGISPKDLKKIFEMEYTTKEKGLGLGLPISNEIIKAHGGEIFAESEPGKGSTFTIILPGVEG